MQILKRPYFLTLLLVSTFFFSSCEKPGQNEIEVIATVDGESISLDEFRLFYELDPNFGLDSSGLPALKDELFFFAYQKVALRKAEQEGLTEDPVFKKAIAWETKQAVLREFYRREILENISVKEEEIKKRYVEDNTEVRVKHLFSKSEEYSKYLADELAQGKTFYELAAKVYRDTVLSRNGGDLGWHKMGSLDADFAQAIHALEKDQISGIVRTSFGYHIIKLINRRSSKMMSESEYLASRPTIEKKIRKSKSEKASRQFIKEFMEDIRPQPVPATFMDLWNAIVPAKDRESIELTNKIGLSDDRIERAMAELGTKLDRILVTSSTGMEMTLRDYLLALREMPISNRPDFKTRRELSHQIAVWVRDHLLYKEAREHDIEQSQNVIDEVKRYKEEQSYHFYLSQLVDKTPVPDYVDQFYQLKDPSILEDHPDLKPFNTRQEWQWALATRTLKKELQDLQPDIRINEALLIKEAKRINWDRRIRMFMIRKPT